MPLIAGPASCLLLGIGFICLPLGTFKAPAVPSRFLLLIWVLFAAYFFFHVISWTFGLFSSLGLPRTINGIMPLMIILCLYGYNQLGVLLKMKFKNHVIIYNYTAILIIGINLVFMVVKLTKHNGSWLELMPTTDELVENKMTDYIKQKYTDYNNRQIIYHAPYLSVLLNTDPTSTVRNTSPNKLYIWDDWYSVVEGGITLDMLRKDTTLVYDTTFTMLTSSGKARSVALFRSK